MATTDTRPGFRLPWSVGHRQSGDQAPAGWPSAAGEMADSSAIDERLAEIEAATRRAAPRAPTEQDGVEPEATMTPTANSRQPAAETDELGEAALTNEAGEAGEAAETDGGTEPGQPVTAPDAEPSPLVADDRRVTDEPAAEQPATSARPGSTRRPAKFLAELTKAMQLAAQAERDETLAQYRAEATSFIEQLHARSSEQAAECRRRADDDLAAIRDWSKAEIARIREETERRMSDRKAGLEEELAAHAARIERAMARIQARVEAYEREMDAFFERLQALEDPTTFAALAASLPESPPFDVDLATDELAADELVIPATVAAEPDVAAATIVAEPIEAVAEPAAAGPEPVAIPFAGRRSSDVDTFGARIAAFGLTPDAAAAEAPAAASDADDEAGVAALDDEALAARLASLVPSGPDPFRPAPGPSTTTTKVVVVGLVSVASIASFKRHLARVPGVQSVGVSSGPDGEFVFTAVHREDVSIHDVVPTLPGFQARVSSAGEGIVRVTARDPESES